MRTKQENQKLAEASLEKLKAAVILNDPHLCVQAMDMVEEDDEFIWEDVSDDVFEEWDEIGDEAVLIINEASN